jgi:hypothetical protein
MFGEMKVPLGEMKDGKKMDYGLDGIIMDRRN